MLLAAMINIDFTPLLNKKENVEQSEDERILLKQLNDPSVKINLIKHRDEYCSFSSVSTYERQINHILTKYANAKHDLDSIRDVRLVSPTKKTLAIHKMLHNQVYIQESGAPMQWSGFNLEYNERLQYIDIASFLRYLWYDQLLNYSGTGPAFCKLKLEKYVKGVVANISCTNTRIDDDLVASITKFVQSKYISDLNTTVSRYMNAFLLKHALNEKFRLYLEWCIILGFVPYKKSEKCKPIIKLETFSDLPKIDLQHLFTIANDIPAISDVAIFVVNNTIECWHLPTESQIGFVGCSNIRVENNEICLGTAGESMFYAELKVMHLAERHFECQTSERYILTEIPKNETAHAVSSEKNDSPLFATLTKAQSALFDENNPLSNFSRIQEKNKHIQDFISRVSYEMNDIQGKMNSFLEDISPDGANTLVDEMVRQGLENYMKNIKPKMDDWERTIRDHLNKFRMQAVKYLSTLPKGLYGLQEKVSELNFNNNMDIDDFMEDIATLNCSKSVPNISHLQDMERSEIDLKQMQDKVSQYFDLAMRFMGYVKDAQKVISKLRVDDSVKDLQVKTLTEQKKEIVKLAKKFREVANTRANVYADQLKDVQKELEQYVHFQSQTAAKTKQHYITLRDTLLTQSGEWVNKYQSKQDRQLKMLKEGFSKQRDSTFNELRTPLERKIEYIKVDGTVRGSKLDSKVDDNTLTMYRENLRNAWKSVLNGFVCIQKTVTNNGVQLYNINEEMILTKCVLPFFTVIYDQDFYISCKGLEECSRIYGFDIAIELIVRRILKTKFEVKTTTVIQQRDSTPVTNDRTGVLLDVS